ncbi:MAG: ABC transporter substrate-binding protein [Candidatus Bathyarchaeota archaeon]|nr:ABC transporter substrate-binding protein [Candidatus Bathyarchaeota archaeon]
MSTQRVWLLAFTALLVVTAAGAAYSLTQSGNKGAQNEGNQPTAPRVINIGVFSSTTANHPIYKFLAEQAQRDFNDYCNRTGRNAVLNVTLGDAKGQPVNAKNFTVMCNKTGIRLVVGFGWSSFFCSSAYTFANQSGMVLLTPSATSPTYHMKDHVFRLCVDDSEQARILTRLLIDRGVQSLVIIARQDSWSDMQIKFVIEPMFTASGGSIQARIDYPLTESPEATAAIDSRLAEAEKALIEANDAHPGGGVAVLLLGFDESAYVLKAASKYPTLMEAPWFGEDGTANNKEILAKAPEAASSVHLISTKLRNPETELAQKLNALWLSTTSVTAGGAGILDYTNTNIYDCVMLGALSLLEANGTSFQAIREAIPKVAATYEGATGPVVLDETGDRTGIDFDLWGYFTVNGVCESKICGRYNATNQTFTWDEALVKP